MLKIYCVNCGEANHYLDKKPSACGYCQKTFSNAKITAAPKVSAPSTVKSHIVIKNEESPPEQIGDFKAEVAAGRPRGVRLDQITTANITARHINKSQILDKKTFWSQFRDESKNKGYAAVEDIDEGEE